MKNNKYTYIIKTQMLQEKISREMFLRGEKKDHGTK